MKTLHERFLEFLDKAIKKHENKYEYEETTFKGSQEKMKIICPIHGEFWQTPSAHVRGNTCPKCANANRGLKDTFDQFLEKAKKIHGNKYNYSKTTYVNQNTKICIICPEHGEFWMTPSAHINKQKQGCPKCAGKYRSTETIISEFNKIHCGKYDYSKVIFRKMHEKVCIICPEHGEFYQTPSKHINGQGCPKCGLEKRAEIHSVTQEEFIERSKKIHGDKYDYSRVVYNGLKNDVEIICKKHGVFFQKPYAHLSGHGCSKCGYTESNAENEIYDFLTWHLGEDDVVKRDREILDGREIDIYIKSLRIGIEYDGLKWHSEEFGKDSAYHLEKTEDALKKGVRIIHIFEDEFNKDKDLVFNKILHIIGKDGVKDKIYARKCVVREIEKWVAQEFLERYHIQGYGKGTVSYGAYFNDELIGVMSFIQRKEEWELVRFATDYRYVCCGVGGKLFKHFLREKTPLIVKSFADRRWTIDEKNNIYTKLGFVLDGVLKPDYKYINRNNPIKRIHKFNFRKKGLNFRYGLPMSMTEAQMADKLGYCKIWDCGLLRYVYKNGTRE